MADWYGKKRLDEEEFQEEDVWGGVVGKERVEDLSPQQVKKSSQRRPSSSSSSSAWSLNAGSRMNIPRAQEPHHHHQHQQQQSSAPVNVPDWSKIYSGKKSNKSRVGLDGPEMGDIGSYQVDDDEDEKEEMVPPHEYIARRMARTQISSFSMCEGVGRTLKGRDLSKLRNAILTKTGFLE